MIGILRQARLSIPPCEPPIWAKTGHLQTILGHVLPSVPLKNRGEEVSIIVEGSEDKIHSTYFAGTSNFVVYLFHGLGGSAEGAYMQRTAQVALGLGHHVFITNHRGCGRGAGLAKETYHSGRSDDLSRVIEQGRARFPQHKHIAVGFSLSANALLLLASGFRAKVLPDFAIAINGPINLDRASVKLTQGLNRIYDKRFLRDMKSYLKNNNPKELKNFINVKDLRDFDEKFTARLGGFKGREDYYRTCSAKQFLSKIQIPTVLLTAKDDPFVSYVDYLEAELSSSTILHLEDHGGHMGYLSAQGMRVERWMDKTLETYLRAAIEVLSG